jgi:CspA family cold shock protein
LPANAAETAADPVKETKMKKLTSVGTAAFVLGGLAVNLLAPSIVFAESQITGKPEKGIVRWFNNDKGYGIIVPASGRSSVFVHHSVIIGNGYQTLNEGENVEFLIVEGPKGLQCKWAKKL